MRLQITRLFFSCHVNPCHYPGSIYNYPIHQTRWSARQSNDPTCTFPSLNIPCLINQHKDKNINLCHVIYTHNIQEIFSMYATKTIQRKVRDSATASTKATLQFQFSLLFPPLPPFGGFSLLFSFLPQPFLLPPSSSSLPLVHLLLIIYHHYFTLPTHPVFHNPQEKGKKRKEKEKIHRKQKNKRREEGGGRRKGRRKRRESPPK